MTADDLKPQALRRRRIGSLLLLATAAGIAAWGALSSSHPALWLACAMVVAVYVWVEYRHSLATDRQLLAALHEREGLLADLRRHRAELLRMQHQRTQMMSGIAHDLRQPLWAVRLCADALLQRQPAAEDADLLRQQMEATEDASAMLDQFSELAAIERGALALRPERVNVREVLESSASTLRALQGRGGRILRLHGRDVWLHTDRTHLARVVHNLAGNALRHSVAARGSQHAKVLLAVRPHGEGWVIDVVDNGRGIPADRIAHVFEPYVQLEPGKSGRQGLGLAIVRGLVATLGMDLDVQSTVGHGTRFRVYVPGTLRSEADEARPVLEASR